MIKTLKEAEPLTLQFVLEAGMTQRRHIGRINMTSYTSDSAYTSIQYQYCHLEIFRYFMYSIIPINFMRPSLSSPT